YPKFLGDQFRRIVVVAGRLQIGILEAPWRTAEFEADADFAGTPDLIQQILRGCETGRRYCDGECRDHAADVSSFSCHAISSYGYVGGLRYAVRRQAASTKRASSSVFGVVRISGPPCSRTMPLCMKMILFAT